MSRIKREFWEDLTESEEKPLADLLEQIDLEFQTFINNTRQLIKEAKEKQANGGNQERRTQSRGN